MLEAIEIILTIIVVGVSILAIILVLMQSGKGGGGGLFGGASGSQSVIGSDKRGDFFTKLTSIFVAIFILGSFALAYLRNKIERPIGQLQEVIDEEEGNEAPMETDAEELPTPSQKSHGQPTVIDAHPTDKEKKNSTVAKPTAEKKPKPANQPTPDLNANKESQPKVATDPTPIEKKLTQPQPPTNQLPHSNNQDDF